MIRYILLLFFFNVACYCQIPHYYSNIDFSQQSSIIENQLSSLITNTHTTEYPYTSNDTDTWDVLKLSDEVQNSPSDVFLIYGFDVSTGISQFDYTRDKNLSCHTSGCSGLWNREHVFAKSLATPPLSVNQEGSGTDIHNLKPCDGDMNSSRSNRLFADGSGNTHITSNGNWYPGDEWKGDVARIIMYMHLRYPNQCNAYSTVVSNGSNFPSLLLEWNAEDPVSTHESYRNNIIFSFQGNRNPFIDNPYLATLLWGGIPADDLWNTFSIDNFSFKSDISIYPSPALNYIKLDGIMNDTYNYKIYSTEGKLLLAGKTYNNKVKVSSLSKGLFFIRFITKKSSSRYKFFKK